MVRHCLYLISPEVLGVSLNDERHCLRANLVQRKINQISEENDT